MTISMKIPSRELGSYFGYGLGQCFSFGLVGSFINYFFIPTYWVFPRWGRVRYFLSPAPDRFFRTGV